MKKFKQIFDKDYLKGGKMEKAANKNDWHKSWKEKKVFKFTWEYCVHCETMFVRCPMCGNNCCNATFGNVHSLFEPAEHGDKNSLACPVCNLAYAYQHLAWKHKDYPEIKKKEKSLAEKKRVKELKELFQRMG